MGIISALKLTNPVDIFLFKLCLFGLFGLLLTIIGIIRTKYKIKRLQAAQNTLRKYKDYTADNPLFAGCGMSTFKSMLKGEKAEFTLRKGERPSDYCIWAVFVDSYPSDFDDTDKYPRAFEGYRVVYDVTEKPCLL